MLAERWRQDHHNQWCDVTIITPWLAPLLLGLVQQANPQPWLQIYKCFPCFKRLHQGSQLVLSMISMVICVVCSGDTNHQCPLLSLLQHGLSVANEILMAFKEEEGYSITGAICPLSKIRLSSSYS